MPVIVTRSLQATLEPASGGRPTWTLVLRMDHDNAEAEAGIYFGDKDYPTHVATIPRADLEAFLQKESNNE